MNRITRWKIANYAFRRVFCVDACVTIVRKWMAAREEIVVVMQASSMWLDWMVGRLLWVDVPARSNAIGDARNAERAFGFSLMMSAVRCILQYVVLPFVLPLVGTASDSVLPVLP
jgi:hypothetical protein